jgi:syntaxin 1B/2/3
MILLVQIQEIQSATRDLSSQIDRIHDLHQRQLAAAVNEDEHARITQDLTAEQDRTRQLSNSLKNEIKRLESATAKRPPNDPDTNVRRTQVGAVKNRCARTPPPFEDGV